MIIQLPNLINRIQILPAPANTDLEAARPRPLANSVPPPTDKVPPTVHILVPPKDQPSKKRRDSDGGTKGSVPSTNGQAPPPAMAAAALVDQPQHARRASRHEEVVDVEDDGSNWCVRHSALCFDIGFVDSDSTLDIGGNCYGGIDRALRFWCHYTPAYYFWVQIAIDTGPLFCILSSSSRDYQLARVSTIKWEFQTHNEGTSGGYNHWISFSSFTGIYRLINPVVVVVSPTIPAVGLSFFSYGFPIVGTCLETGAYLRKISILGHHIFLIYAVHLGLAITWAFAFMLTEAGLYNYKGCDINIPASNMVSQH
ncbi:hypothetical protein PIB30_098423 [Stylosanthes scabra]|uniref:Uncharacterized protein n=1 Tax=Stylosanthes scabra TaxID=79078 RepID=A0ABU6TZ27_9FABA|nr:hypothetical protein [Stylosanthes scabra]